MATGLQHVVAMFGATVLAPRLMGFDANIAILMSGIGTLLFFVVTRGKVPSYLGSSFAFIAVVLTATGFSGGGANPNLGVALGGIVACGVLYALIGLAVMATGTAWIEQLMPPVVTGTVVAVIGLNLAAIPVKTIAPTAFDTWMQAMTCVALAIVAVRARGMAQRLLILVGLLLATLVYTVLTNGLGLGTSVSLAPFAAAPWLGMPGFAAPIFSAPAILLIALVAFVLVAENLGHLKAVAAMTGRDMDPHTGRAFLGDGLATVLAGASGGTGVTTYAENIGVRSATAKLSGGWRPVPRRRRPWRRAATTRWACARTSWHCIRASPRAWPCCAEPGHELRRRALGQLPAAGWQPGLSGFRPVAADR